MQYTNIHGVPEFEATEYSGKQSDYCILMPILNEGERIIAELKRALEHDIPNKYDIIICDGNSTDGCTEESSLCALGVNTLLFY